MFEIKTRALFKDILLIYKCKLQSLEVLKTVILENKMSHEGSD
jgi:hypothetical protein